MYAHQDPASKAVDLKRMVRASLDGYHATIFAYGQTGSGKTHTMVWRGKRMGEGGGGGGGGRMHHTHTRKEVATRTRIPAVDNVVTRS